MARVLVDGEGYQVDRFPNEWPLCHKGVLPIARRDGIEIEGPYSTTLVQAVFLCPACKNLFIGYYENTGREARLQSVGPVRAKVHTFPLLESVSPQFVRIYNQAVAAEGAGLSEVSGLGYRKALEFLIKDFCIARDPSSAEAIKREFLGVVIKTRIDNPKVRLAAEKVAWLGNDEAHYVRKWEAHDIEHLKTLLRITSNGISEQLEFDSLMTSFEPTNGN